MDTIYQLGMLFSVIDKLSGPVQQMARSVSDFDKVASKAKGVTEFGQRLGVSALVVEKAAEKMWKTIKNLWGPVDDVNDALAALETVATPTLGTMQQSLAATKQAALDWSKTHVQSAKQYLDAAQLMASAGLTDVQAIEGVKVALTLATATMGDNNEAANLLATVYNNIGDKAKDAGSEMGRLGDIMAKTQALYQIPTLGQLGEGLKYAVPAALAARVEFDELNTVLGALNNAGLQGGQAGTAYAATLRQMTKASSALGFEVATNAAGGTDLIKTIENIAAKYGDLTNLSPKIKMAFQSAFRDEGMRTIMLLSSKTGELRTALDGVRDSAGTAMRAQAIREASDQTEILANNWQAVKLTIGEHLTPVVQQVIPPIIGMIQSMGRFAKAHPTLVKTAVLLLALGAGILAIAAPILSVTSGFLIMLGSGMTAWAKIGKGYLAFKKLLESGKIVTLFGQMGRGAMAAFGGVAKAVSGVGASILGVLKAAGAGILGVLTNPLTWIIVGVVAAIAAVALLIKHWDKVKAAMQSAVGAVRGALDWIRGLVGRFRESGAALWRGFVEGITSWIMKPVDVVKAGLAKLRELLPFSDAKEGPLSTLSKSGRAFIATFRAGAERELPSLKDTLAGGLAGAWRPIPQLSLAAGYSAPVAVHVAAPIIDLSQFAAARRSQVGGKDGKPKIVIQGGLHLHVDKVESEDDLLSVLRRWYEEVAV